MKRALVNSVCLITALFPIAGCSGLPGTEADVPCIHYAVDADDHEGLPDDIQGMAVTHAVRAQAYACVDNEWHPIGGLAYAYIDGQTVQPNATGGVSVAGAATTWPYVKDLAYLPFQLPLYIQPGLAVTMTASFDSLLDAGEMIACWFVNQSGQELSGTRGEDIQTINGGGLATANCLAAITG